VYLTSHTARFLAKKISMTYGATSVNNYYVLLFASEMSTVLDHDTFGFLGLVL